MNSCYVISCYVQLQFLYPKVHVDLLCYCGTCRPPALYINFVLSPHTLNTIIGRTVVVIAHRLSTIRNADMIAVIHNGMLREVGIGCEH